jgi:alginate O-acetyltransferase complex protein AlgI
MRPSGVILAALKSRPLIAAGIPYADMLASGFIPLGFSYLAFRVIHVLIEVRRNQMPVPSLTLYLAYLFFLPAYTAGPIDRLNRFSIPTGRLNPDDLSWGIRRIAVGFIKKFVLAEGFLRMAASIPAVSSALAADPSAPSTAHCWEATSSAYLRIYLDFAAYSDIALGTARLFGVTLMENFNAPILATNPSDFWRRWHISLSIWCQHYVYMPAIGWMRNPNIPQTLSFLAMGLWHLVTLNRVGWALYNAGGVAGYMQWNRWMNGEDQSLGDSLKLLGRLVGIR